eukprot:2965068-Amphidinium_carterae.1
MAANCLADDPAFVPPVADSADAWVLALKTLYSTVLQHLPELQDNCHDHCDPRAHNKDRYPVQLWHMHSCH